MSFRQKRYFENSEGQTKYFSDRLFNREELRLIQDSGFRI